MNYNIEYVPNHIYRIEVWKSLDEVKLSVSHAPYTEHPKTYRTNMFGCSRLSKGDLDKITPIFYNPRVFTIPESKEQLVDSIQEIMQYYQEDLEARKRELEETLDSLAKVDFQVL